VLRISITVPQGGLAALGTSLVAAPGRGDNSGPILQKVAEAVGMTQQGVDYIEDTSKTKTCITCIPDQRRLTGPGEDSLVGPLRERF